MQNCHKLFCDAVSATPAFNLKLCHKDVVEEEAKEKEVEKKVVRYGKGGKEIIKEEKKKENKRKMLKNLKMEEKKK